MIKAKSGRDAFCICKERWFQRPPAGYGLLVHAEDYRLRTNSKAANDCHDYIEFGREDDIPLWTMDRSGKLCGSRPNVKYHVSLLVPAGVSVPMSFCLAVSPSSMS